MLSKIKKVIIFLLFTFLSYSFNHTEEVIDRVLASVGDEAITLSDLKIVIHFNIYPEIEKKYIKKYIERIIDQKIVKRKVKMSFPLDEEIEKEKNRLIKWFGSEERFFNELLKFDLTWDDLKKYIEEKIYYEKIIKDKFKFISPITLDEIKKYYNEVYVPEQKKKNLYPKSLLEVASEIESIIENQKRKSLISKWLEDLKKEENIEIKIKDINEILAQLKINDME
ncbi:hypothetical protein NLD30_10540 [SCandidatus Aminicenantes bacterium Aminicenantia_JdfR_composite]|jgi:hypothetical protein|nr:hypothetical protein [SCandidatus Aminicenantes bacterium Aminicenantia_JdfR_composite]MCP2606437.1 hypothetical protein [Candidatus Aminicenantes bacterium AC-708-I09]